MVTVNYTLTADTSAHDQGGAGVELDDDDTIASTSTYQETFGTDWVARHVGTVVIASGGSLVVTDGGGNFTTNKITNNGRVIADCPTTLTWTNDQAAVDWNFYANAYSYTLFNGVTYATSSGNSYVFVLGANAVVEHINSVFTWSKATIECYYTASIGMKLWSENCTYTHPSPRGLVGYGNVGYQMGEITCISPTFTSTAGNYFVNTGGTSAIGVLRLAGNVKWGSPQVVLNPAALTTGQWFDSANQTMKIEFYSKVTTTVTGGTTPVVGFSHAGDGCVLNSKVTGAGKTTAGVNTAYVLCSEHHVQYNSTNQKVWSNYVSDQTLGGTQYSVVVGETSYKSTSQTFWGMNSGAYATGVAIAITETAATDEACVDLAEIWPSDGTDPQPCYANGATVYVSSNLYGSIINNGADDITDIAVTLKLYTSLGVLVHTEIDVTCDITSGSQKTLYELNSNVVPQYAGLTTSGEYYWTLTVNGAGATPSFTAFEQDVFFKMEAAAPTIGTTTLSDYAITTAESTVATMTVTNYTDCGGYLYVYGGGRTAQIYVLTHNGTGTFTATIRGDQLGTQSGASLLFFTLNLTGGSDYDIDGSTLTVTSSASNSGDVAKDIADYLATLGVGTVGTDIFYYGMPDSPDDCVAVMQGPGSQGDPVINYVYPSLQVLVRNDSNTTGLNTALNIHDLLHQVTNTTINSRMYHRIDALGRPALAGKDRKGRATYTINFRVIKEMNT